SSPTSSRSCGLWRGCLAFPRRVGSAHHLPPARSDGGRSPPYGDRRTAMTYTPRILMCPPDHYGIEYEINPWMSRSRGSTTELAQGQWRNLHETLKSLGVQLELMEPHPGLPDLVFTANAGL